MIAVAEREGLTPSSGGKPPEYKGVATGRQAEAMRGVHDIKVVRERVFFLGGRFLGAYVR